MVEAKCFKPKIKFDTRILSVISICWRKNHLPWYSIPCFTSPIQYEGLMVNG